MKIKWILALCLLAAVVYGTPARNGDGKERSENEAPSFNIRSKRQASKPYILTAGICVESPEKSCCKATSEVFDVLNSPGSALFAGSLRYPVCRGDGGFAPRQCTIQGCHCVDPDTGKRLPDQDKYDLQCHEKEDSKAEIDDCASNPCQHGQCQDKLNNYTCTCDEGWTGKNCDQDIDDCASEPCQHGQCQDKLNNYTCACHCGWTGKNCDEDSGYQYYYYPPYKKLPWREAVQYCYQIGSTLVMEKTAEVHESAKYYLENMRWTLGNWIWIGVSDLDGDFKGDFKYVDGSRVTTPYWTISWKNDYNKTTQGYGRYKKPTGHCVAAIKDRYQGSYSGWWLPPPDSDIWDECCAETGGCNKSMPFLCQSQCHKKGKSNSYVFDSIWNDYCPSNPCQHGSCEEKDGGYLCTCENGWGGKNCDDVIDDCSTEPCKHGRCQPCQDGECPNQNYKCICDCGWSGENCDQSTNFRNTYRLHYGKTWQEAVDACEAEGSVLTIDATPVIHNFVYSYVRRSSKEDHTTGSLEIRKLWLGASRDPGGELKFIDGTRVETTYFWGRDSEDAINSTYTWGYRNKDPQSDGKRKCLRATRRSLAYYRRGVAWEMGDCNDSSHASFLCQKCHEKSEGDKIVEDTRDWPKSWETRKTAIYGGEDPLNFHGWGDYDREITEPYVPRPRYVYRGL